MESHTVDIIGVQGLSVEVRISHLNDARTSIGWIAFGKVWESPEANCVVMST